MMEFLTAMATAVNLAVLIAAGLGGLHLARRGGFAPAEIGMGLLGLGQLAGPGEPPGWGWLLRTGAALVVIYVMWEMGRMVAAVRGLAPVASSPSRERGVEASPPDPFSLPERGKQEVRAVASWPGRRPGR